MTQVVVDPSALVAIHRQEHGSTQLFELLIEADERYMSAPSLLEFGMVLEGRTLGGAEAGLRFARDSEVAVVAFDEAMAVRALEAFRRFGKGKHPAALNFGDCCTYALAEDRGLPILCVGDDFTKTDVPVLPER